MTTGTDICDALARAEHGAAFVDEVRALLGPRFDAATFATALDDLAASGAVAVTAKPLPDPHLAGMDLRIVARVDGAGAEARSRAVAAIERHWNAWLSDFFANHRCS